MSSSPEWKLEEFLPLLRLEARLLRLDPRLQPRFGLSDLVQIALDRANQGLAEFRGTTRGEVVRWLREILLNCLRDKVREEHAQKRDVAREQSLRAVAAESSARLDALLAADQTSPSEQVEQQERLLRLTAALDGALEQLPEDQRDVVILSKLHGLPAKEIAEQLGRTEKSVRLLLYRGIKKLGTMSELREFAGEDPEDA